MHQNTTSPETDLIVKQIESLAEVKAEDWNHLSISGNPFLSHEYLLGLESCDCLREHGWTPGHLTVHQGNMLIGALPLYYKTNSYGEFVFDWSWADAYERAGGSYYPKLVSAIPFAPVQGTRLLINNDYTNPDTIRKLIVRTVMEITRSEGISSFHCLFPETTDRMICENSSLLSRMGLQYHWQNQGYRDFDDFLDNMKSKKRKQIKRERRQVRDTGIETVVLTGNEISPQQWQTFYEFYCSTFYRRWGSPRLTYDFFRLLSEKLPDQTLLILASKNGEYVAGAFAMRSETTLYGRHWGCNSQYPNLHFELCYYQTIEYCINHGLKTLDAGVQGEHKLSRGFRPVATWSTHWIQHEAFRKAISDFLDYEKKEVDTYIRQLNNHLPFKDCDIDN